MLKKDFRALDKKPGMKFRLICNGKTGTAESFFKDAVMLSVNEPTAADGKRRTFCPCEMVELPVGEWKRTADRVGNNAKTPGAKEGTVRRCKMCGKKLPSDNKYFCSRECYKLWSRG